MMACVTGGEPTRALDILERVKRSTGGVNEGPDMLTYTSAITACAAEGETRNSTAGGKSVMLAMAPNSPRLAGRATSKNSTLRRHTSRQFDQTKPSRGF